MAPDEKIAAQIRGGLAWVGMASTLISVLDVIASLVIPALLGPKSLGIAAAALWLFPIFDIFVDAGLATALIRGPETTEERVSTVFWANLLMSLVAAGAILVFAQPLTGNAIAASILMVYAGKLVFHNVYFVPQALLRRELRFRELSLVRIAANVANTGVKLGTAIAGAGAWSLLYGNLSHAVVTGIGIQLCRPWFPRLVFRTRSAVGDLRFGGLIALREILYFFYVNVDYRVVIAFFGTLANGFYKFAFELVLDPVRTVSLVINEVALPSFARLRTNPRQLVDQFVSFARLNLVVVLPIVVLLAIEVDDLIAVIPGWHDYGPSIRTVRIFAGVGVLRALSFLIPPLLDALGRPLASLAYTIFAALLLPALYIGCAYYLGPELGHDAVALAWVIGYPLAFVLLIWLTLTSIDLRARELVSRTIGIPGCVLGGALVAWALRAVLDPHAAAVRVAAVSAAFLVVTFTLLDYLQDLGPRQIVASLKKR